MATTHWAAQLMLLAVAMIWGSTYGVSKTALQYYPVLAFIALRFLITFSLLFPHFCRQSTAVRRATSRVGWKLGLLLTAIFLCEIYGVAQTSASKAAFLISLCLPLTPVAQWCLLGQKPQPATWLYLGLALCGAALLCDLSEPISTLNMGDVLILSAAILRAICVALSCKWLQQNSINALALSCIQAGMIGFITLGLACITIPLEALVLPRHIAFWGNVLFLVLFASVFAFFAQNWAAARLNPTRVAALLGLEPLFGALYGRLFLAEQLSPIAVCGALLMLFAIMGLSGNWPPLFRIGLQKAQDAMRSMAPRRKTSG